MVQTVIKIHIFWVFYFLDVSRCSITAMQRNPFGWEKLFAFLSGKILYIIQRWRVEP
jgi:hypothetical protein